MHRSTRLAALYDTCSAEYNDVTYENYEKKVERKDSPFCGLRVTLEGDENVTMHADSDASSSISGYLGC